MDQVIGQLQSLLVQLTAIADFLWPFAHPKDAIRLLLQDSLGLLVRV